MMEVTNFLFRYK